MKLEFIQKIFEE